MPDIANVNYKNKLSDFKWVLYVRSDSSVWDYDIPPTPYTSINKYQTLQNQNMHNNVLSFMIPNLQTNAVHELILRPQNMKNMNGFELIIPGILTKLQQTFYIQLFYNDTTNNNNKNNVLLLKEWQQRRIEHQNQNKKDEIRLNTKYDTLATAYRPFRKHNQLFQWSDDFLG